MDRAGFAWTGAADAQGTDLAVLALPGRGDVLVYPANFVAKRWERPESGFRVASFEAIQSHGPGRAEVKNLVRVVVK